MALNFPSSPSLNDLHEENQTPNANTQHPKKVEGLFRQSCLSFGAISCSNLKEEVSSNVASPQLLFTGSYDCHQGVRLPIPALYLSSAFRIPTLNLNSLKRKTVQSPPT